VCIASGFWLLAFGFWLLAFGFIFGFVLLCFALLGLAWLGLAWLGFAYGLAVGFWLIFVFGRAFC
jgi:hypothetical protein